MVRKKRTVLYFVLAVGMLIYALPRLSIGQGWTEETIFSAAWIGMALLIIAALLYELFGVDEKAEEDLKAIRRYRYWRLQQKIIEQSQRNRASNE